MGMGCPDEFRLAGGAERGTHKFPAPAAESLEHDFRAAKMKRLRTGGIVEAEKTAGSAAAAAGQYKRGSRLAASGLDAAGRKKLGKKPDDHWRFLTVMARRNSSRM